MTTPTKEQQEAFVALQSTFKAIAEQEEREYTARQVAQRTGFFGAIPENATSLYIHLSHKISKDHHMVRQIQKDYGTENLLITTAPSASGQSFYDNHLDEIAKREKTNRIIKPFKHFSAKKNIDAIIYLCDYLCDGYQSPIFPQDVVTEWHIWRPIKLAQQLQKPLIVGYQQNFCFSVECYEREYITNQEKIRVPIKIIKI
ncbi:MAG: hypothetical protein Q7K45_01755 [Nanoarchaeota archaeon]|nr:hypothetical protein [Nanoarchaeota archaeon]